MGKPEQQDIDDFLEEHLPYEVDMLRVTLDVFHRLGPGVGDNSVWQFAANVFIESFCVHARNLIEFFEGMRNCDFDPRQFATKGYDLRRQLGPAYGKICAQITHLTTARTRSRSGKIDDALRADVIAKLEAEIERLEKSLAPEFRAKWRVKPRPAGQ